MPNWDRINRVLDRIEADPTSFDMATYYADTSCGTVACFAGHACLEAGLRPGVMHKLPHEEDVFFLRHQYRKWMDDPAWAATRMRQPGVLGWFKRIEAGSFAEEWLGLTWEQATQLFLSFDVRTPAELRARVYLILGPDPTSKPPAQVTRKDLVLVDAY